MRHIIGAQIIRRAVAVVVKFEELNLVIKAAELVLHPQCIGAPGDRDQKVHSVLGEYDIVARDRLAKLHAVIDRDFDAGPIIPCRARALVDDGFMAITDVEQVGVAAVMANQRRIAAAPVERLGKVRAFQRLAWRGGHYRHAVGVEQGVIQRRIGELEMLGGIGLLAIARILVLQRDGFASGRHCENHVAGRARKSHLGAGNPLQHQRVVAAAIENGVVAIAEGKNIGIIAAVARQQVIPGAAVKNQAKTFGQATEAVERIVAAGGIGVDIMLQRLLPAPYRAVRKLELLDPVRLRQPQRVGLGKIENGDLVGCAGNAHRQVLAVAIAEEIQIRPPQIVLELQNIGVGVSEKVRAVVAFFNDILAIAAPEHIRVRPRTAAEIIIARAAIQGIIVEKAVNNVVACGLLVGNHLRGDLHEI